VIYIIVSRLSCVVSPCVVCSQNQLVSEEQFVKGFARVYESLPDLSLDIPNARELADAFKARAVADKVLPEEAEEEVGA
jgi:hypothetical protein